MSEAPKTMIFFSLHYPFHFTDSYLDEEIDLLSKQFEKVIVISANTFSTEKRETPSNATVYRFQPEANLQLRIRSLSLLVRPFFYKELFNILFLYKSNFTLASVKELFAFYTRSLATYDLLKQVIVEQKINKNDLLIYTYWMVESSMAATIIKRENPSIKFISKAHSQDVYFDRSPVKYHPYRKFIFENINRLFFISEDAKKYFIRKHQVSAKEEKRISISRIGINADNKKYIPKNHENVLRIISVAYIQKIKRIDLIVDALSLIKNIKIEWCHAGHSNQSEKEFEDIKEYTSQKFSSATNISFSFLGKTSKEDLFQLYKGKNFDLFLNVSETEGIPVSMMEAMSYSIPVIGTNVGGVSEIVEDSKNGFLLPSFPSVEETADIIRKFYVLKDSEINRIRKKAFETWGEKYNANRNYSELCKEVLVIRDQL